MSGTTMREAFVVDDLTKDSQRRAADPDALGAALDALAPLGEAWRDLVVFTARYYQRSLGEIALAALPPQLRDLSGAQLARRLKRRAAATGAVAPAPVLPVATEVPAGPDATPEQADALRRIDAEPGLRIVDAAGAPHFVPDGVLASLGYGPLPATRAIRALAEALQAARGYVENYQTEGDSTLAKVDVALEGVAGFMAATAP